jgi:hypothetical protein
VDEEWRVSLVGCIQLASGKPASAGTVRDLLGSRAGGEVSVTAGKAGVFLYAATADAAAAAAGVAQEELAQQGLAADIRVERWDPSHRAWLPPGGEAAPEQPSEPECGPGRSRLRAVGAVMAAMIDGIGGAGS